MSKSSFPLCGGRSSASCRDRCCRNAGARRRSVRLQCRQAFGSGPCRRLQAGQGQGQSLGLWFGQQPLAVQGRPRQPGSKVPVTGKAMDICLPVPAPGRYAVAVHHDLNTNGERDRHDGGGYSRNPEGQPAQSEAGLFQGGVSGRQRAGAGRRNPALRQGPRRGPGGNLMTRPRIALISNPKSTGNLAQLPRIRAFCASIPISSITKSSAPTRSARR